MIEVAIAFAVKYRREIAEVLVLVLVASLLYWGFVHNPAVIKELKSDIEERDNRIDAMDHRIKLYEDIQKGKVIINAAVQTQISSLRSASRPRRAIIIRSGMPLPALRNGAAPL